MTVAGDVERLLAELVADSGVEGRITQGARSYAVTHAVDCVGVILASRAESAAAILDTVTGPSTVLGASLLGTRSRRSVAVAAWVNATLAHLLDFDDHGFSHPTAILLPVALAVAEDAGSTGEEAVTALVLGYEVFERLARSARPNEPATRGRGIHPTSVYGAPAAAAVAARLWGLDVEETIVAFGLAATQGFGLSQQFGTWAKGVNAGNAAQAGITAAALAMRGFRGDASGISGRYGLFEAIHGGAYDLALAEEPAGRWAIENPGLALKPYPACTSNLKAVDAMIQIVEETPGYDPEEVRSVRVDVHPDIFHTLRHRRPTVGFNGKFSLDYTVATAALDRTLALESFSDERANRPELRRMLDKVDLVEHPEWEMSDRRRMPVEVTFADGSRITREVESHRGTRQWPMTDDEIHAKFLDCAARAIDVDDAAALYDVLSRLDGQETVAAVLHRLAAAAPLNRQEHS